MEKTPNRISSPEATGGAGPTFEQKVGAYWVSILRQSRRPYGVSRSRRLERGR